VEWICEVGRGMFPYSTKKKKKKKKTMMMIYRDIDNYMPGKSRRIF
jgi:hypothetical protein